MKLNARKTLVKALGDASLRDFKTTEEMEMSKNLYSMMAKNDNDEVKPRKRRSKKETEESKTLFA